VRVRATETGTAGLFVEEAFTITVSDENEAVAYDDWAANAGLTGDDALQLATPFDDGVPNLLKYAFNMNGGAPDRHGMEAGGNSGLPLFTVEGGPPAVIRVEFVRRIDSGLLYVPQTSETLASGSWAPLTVSPAITPIDGEWERVVYEKADALPACFLRVQVMLP